MSNNANQSKPHRIYVKESKSWVDVSKEFYTNYYRDINAYRKRQGSAKPTRIKVVIMLQKAPMPTLFVNTSSAKHLA